MYYQNEPGIYVYYWKPVYFKTFGTRRLFFTHYESLDIFFHCNHERLIKEQYGYSPNDTICTAVVGMEYGRGYGGKRYIREKTLCGKHNCHEHDDHIQAWAAYDQFGKLYTPEHLIGLWREWAWNRYNSTHKTSRWSRRNGVKKRTFGGFRKIKTFQERKWIHAWDDEEFAPKPRARRSGRNLPDAWDDYMSHNDKSWKTQSKRKHQWKER